MADQDYCAVLPVKQVHMGLMPVSVRTAEAFSSTIIYAGRGTESGDIQQSEACDSGNA